LPPPRPVFVVNGVLAQFVKFAAACGDVINKSLPAEKPHAARALRLRDAAPPPRLKFRKAYLFTSNVRRYAP